MIKNTAEQDLIIEAKKWHQRAGVRWGAFGLVAVIILNGFVWSNDSAEQSVDRDQLLIASVSQGLFERDIAATGRMIASDAPTLFATEEGQIELLVDAGERVTIGQILARITSPNLESLLAEYRVSLAIQSSRLARMELTNRQAELAADKTVDMAQVDLAAAERELRRAEQLFEHSLISQIDYDVRVDDLQKSRLQFQHAVREAELSRDFSAFELEQSRAEVARQEILVQEVQRRMDALAVRSPVDGAVGNLLVSDQSRIPSGTPILSVVDLSAYEVELQISDVYGDDLGIGMPVTVSVGGQQVMAEISAISPEIRSNQLVARATILDQQGLSLRQNQRVSARIFLERYEDALLVRRGSFVDNGNRSFAYRVEADRLVRIPIVVGAVGTRNVQIIEGVTAGDEIVVSSYDNFDDLETLQIH
ncbi:MAG: HlyD family efflux transporter periplasmic adaptor subunit [Pseudomonadales bacterium]|jgi:HlyD family secretion protein